MFRKNTIGALLVMVAAIGLSATVLLLAGRRQPQLVPAQAGDTAVHVITATERGFLLSHPLHTAAFTKDGVQFLAKPGPVWAWQLQFVGNEAGTPLPGVNIAPLAPRQAAGDQVAFARGALTEQYVAHAESIEQQFVLHQMPQLTGDDLVIAGKVTSNGTFAVSSDGWLWARPEGVVSLGDVFVYDAQGQEIPATLQVQADATRIQVNGEALAGAIFPVTIDPEIGTNDFRISNAGPDGNANFDAFAPAIAYNSTHHEYLVVWAGEVYSPSLGVSNKIEIFGQRIDAASGSVVGNDDFRISGMGNLSDNQFAAQTPAVAYNSTNDEYLVVWAGDDLTNDEFEIYGQRIPGDLAAGDEAGNDDFRLSDMGVDGDSNFAGIYPDVAYNNLSNEYLVVWAGDDLTNNEFEIYGQRVEGDLTNGDEVGNGDFRLSDMGVAGSSAYRAERPSVSYNSTNNEYLVVWAGDDDASPLVDDEFEIFGQRVLGDRGAGDEVGANDFRISDMGTNDGDTAFAALHPDVAYNSTHNEYLVVWMGDDDTGTLANDAFEVFGHRVAAATGIVTATNDIRLSDMGSNDGNSGTIAYQPQVVYNSFIDRYLLVWRGDDDTAPLVEGEYEIFAQELFGDAALGDEIGPDQRLSDMGSSDGNTTYYADHAAIATSEDDLEYLIIWQGDDDSMGLADDEVEIYGQSYAADVAVAPVLEILDTGRPTALLLWTTSATNCSYDMHKGTTPYGGQVYLATVPSGFYFDGSSTGSVAENYYYFVRAHSCGGLISADSNEVGEFDFAITPGN